MNKREKTLLWVGLFLWVVGDLITTYIGFNLGIPESNPFLVGRSFLEIAALKLLAAIIVLKIIYTLEKIKTNNELVDKFSAKFLSHYPKGLVVYGVLIIIFNTVSILWVIT